MEKYGTYEVYKDKKTGEIIREPVTGEASKEASKEDKKKYIKLEKDPQDEEK
jgi:hypothetical protein